MELQLQLRKRQGAFSLAVDLSVSGDRLGIFGPSGSGKSSLAGLVAGLSQPDSGQIILDGQTLFDARQRIDLPPEQRRIGLVFQQHALFPHLNVRQNLLYGFRRCPAVKRRIELDEVADLLGLTPLCAQKPAHLSGGERQRVALGRAILASPRLLIMDEPLSALDDELRYRIIPYLRLVSERFSIPFLFISHSLLEMRLMAERVVVLDQGGLQSVVSPEELARQRMGQYPSGYSNLLKVGTPREVQGLLAFPWEGGELLLSGATLPEAGVVELSSKDIILCKRHPEAISARNLLPCTVRSLFESNRRTGVELECNGAGLVAEIVPDAARELAISPGSTIWAAIKASAFRRL